MLIVLALMALWGAAPTLLKETSSSIALAASSAPLYTGGSSDHQVNLYGLWQVDPPTDTPTPTFTATVTDTPPPDDPNATNTPTPIPVEISSVQGRVFQNPGPVGTPIFLVTTATPPVFTNYFPVISFDPPAGTMPCSTNVNSGTRPFTDVIPGTPGTPCATQIVQTNVGATPTQAGVGGLTNFHMLLTGHIRIPDGVALPALVTFKLSVDDSYKFGVGPNEYGEQPDYVSGMFSPPTPTSLTPWPTSAFEGYRVVSRWQTVGQGVGMTTVSFPSTGYYPFELDYTESAAGDLMMVLGTTANNPIPNGISPTPTRTATPTNTPSHTPTNTATPTCFVPTTTPYPWGCSVKATSTSTPTAPRTANSYYVAPTNTRNPQYTATATPVGWRGWWWEKGYEDASKRISNGGPNFSVAVLDFGAPYFLPFGQDPNDPNAREWGTLYAHTDRPFISIEDIKRVAGDYAQGYFKRVSLLPPTGIQPRVIIGMGTNNLWWPDMSISAVDFHRHGNQWGRMVNDLNLTYKDYYPTIEFEGATDIEFGWSTPDYTLNWTQGFEEVTRAPLGYPAERHYYNYGDCADCFDGLIVTDPNKTDLANPHPIPRVGAGTPTPTPIIIHWTLDEAVAAASANRAALPLPEIYFERPSQSTQWQWLDMYAATHYLCFDDYDVTRGIPGKMRIQGVMTSPNNVPPGQAWQDLWAALDNRSCLTTENMDRITPMQFYPNDK